jgi:hypothetical protein
MSMEALPRNPHQPTNHLVGCTDQSILPTNTADDLAASPGVH